MEQEQNVTEINLKEIFAIFLKRWWLIALATVLCAAMAFGFRYVTTDTEYKATGYVYINNSLSLGSASVSISAGDINASASLVETYSAIAFTRTILENVITKCNMQDDITVEQLAKALSISSVSKTSVLKISVTTSDKSTSRVLTNAMIDVLTEKIPKIIEGSSVNPFDYAVDPKTSESRGLSKYTLIGAVLGLVLSCGVVFVFDYIVNDTIQSSEWIENTFGEAVPVLAVIPDENAKSSHRYGYKYAYAYKDHSSSDKKQA